MKKETFVLQVLKIDSEMHKCIQSQCDDPNRIHGFIIDCIHHKKANTKESQI